MKYSNSIQQNPNFLTRFIEMNCELNSSLKLSRRSCTLILLLSYFQIFSIISDFYNDFTISTQTISQSPPAEDFLFNMFNFSRFSILFLLYSNYPILYIIFYVVFGLLCLSTLVCGIIVLFVRDLKPSLKSLILNKLKFVAQIYEPLLFLPAHVLFIRSFSKIVNNFETVDSLLDSETEKIGIGSLGFFFCGINIINGFIFSFFGDNPMDEAEDNLLSKISNFENKLLYFFKLIVPIFIYLGLSNQPLYTIARLAATFIIFSSLAVAEINTPSYFDLNISKISVSLKSLMATASFGALVVSLSLNANVAIPHGGFIICIFSSPFIVRAVVSLIQFKINSIYLTPDKGIQRPVDFIIKFKEYSRLLKIIMKERGSDKPIDIQEIEMGFQGKIARHVNTCPNSDCVCKQREKIFDPRTKINGNDKLPHHQDKAFLIHYGRMSLTEGCRRFRDNADLEIFNAYYLVSALDYVHQSYMIIQSLQNKNLSSRELQMIAFTKKKILSKLEGKYDERTIGNEVEIVNNNELIDSTRILDVEAKMTEFKLLILKSLSMTIEVWEMLKKNEIILKQVGILSGKLEKVSFDLEALFKEFSQIPHGLQDFYHLLYGLYLMNIRNDLADGAKKIKRAYSQALVNHNKIKLAREINSKSLYDDDIVCVKISGEKNNLGTIYQSNCNLETVFGKVNNSLIGKNINELIPHIYKYNHHHYIHGYLESGRESLLYKMRSSFGLHEKGHIFPITLYVKITPDLGQGLTYVGLIKPKRSFEYYILTNSAGIIDSISENLANDLGLHPKIFQEEQITMSHISPDCDQIIEAFNHFIYEKHGSQIFSEEVALQTKSKAKTRFMKGTYKSFNSQQLAQYVSESYQVSEEERRVYEDCKEKFSSGQEFSRIKIAVPTSILEYDLEIKSSENKMYKKGTLTQTVIDHKSEEKYFYCNVEEHIHKNCQIVRVFKLKPAKEDNIEEIIASKSEINKGRNSATDITSFTKRRPANRGDGTLSPLDLKYHHIRFESEQSPKFKEIYSKQVQVKAKSRFDDSLETTDNTKPNMNSLLNGLGTQLMSSEIDSKLAFELNEKQKRFLKNSYIDPNIFLGDISLNIGTDPEENNKSGILDTSAAPFNLDNSRVHETLFDEKPKNFPQIRLKPEKRATDMSNMQKSNIDGKIISLDVSRSKEYYFEKKFNYGNFKIFDDDDRSSTMSKSSQGQGFYRLYSKALSERYFSPSFETITKSMWAILILNLLLSLVVYASNVSSIEETEANIQIQRTSSNLNYYSLSLFRRFKSVDLLLKNIISNSRFTILGFPDYYSYGQNFLGNFIQMFEKTEENFHQELSGFSNEFISSIFDYKIDISQYDIITKTNIVEKLDFFQVSGKIIVNSMECINYDYNQMSSNLDNIQDRVSIIIDITPNDLLLICDQIQKTLNNEIDKKNEEILLTSYLICGIIIGVVVVAFFSFIFLLYKLSAEREKSLSLISLVEIGDIDTKYEYYKKFKSLIEYCNNDSDYLMAQLQESKTMNCLLIKGNSRKSKQRKNLINRGIYRRVWTDMTKISVLFIISVAYFTYSMVNFQEFMTYNSQIIHQIDITQQTMVNETYLWEAVRLLVAENGTGTLLNEDPLNVYNNFFKYLKETTAITSVYFDDNHKIDPQVESYLKSDLCSTVNITICPTLAQGTLSKGLLLYQSYLINILSTIFDQWANIRYRNYDKELLSDQRDFVDLEYTFSNVIRPRYILLLDYLQSRFIAKNTSQKDFSGSLLAIFLCLMISLIYVVWIPLYSEMKDEQFSNKEIFRLIPPDVILKNSFIKLQLKRYSTKTLSAYKL